MKTKQKQMKGTKEAQTPNENKDKTNKNRARAQGGRPAHKSIES